MKEMHVLVEYYSILFHKTAHYDNFFIKKEICPGYHSLSLFGFYNLYQLQTPHIDVTEESQRKRF